MLAPVLAIGAAACGAVQEQPVSFVPDETVQGVITEDDPVVRTPGLDALNASAPTVGQCFSLRVEEPGPYYIDLSSYFFDAYLILRDSDGNVLAEDDDGLLGKHARVSMERLVPGGTYALDACALHGGRGPFELILRKGHPGTLSYAERVAAEIEDATRAVTAIDAVAGSDGEALIGPLNDLGTLLREWGDYANARPLFERALAVCEESLGPKHISTAAILNNLALVLDAQGDYGAAYRLFQRALAICEEVHGPKHPSTATCLGNLADQLCAQGDYDAARPLFERVLEISLEVNGPEHQSTGMSLNNLAELLWEQGEYEAARPLYERALAILRKVRGEEHPETASVLSNLAILLLDQGDYDAARPLCERALAIREVALGPDHPDTAFSLNNLAELLLKQRDYEAARPLYERALALREAALGPDHPQTAASLHNLAAVLNAQGNGDAARPLYVRALAIYEKASTREHPDTATNLSNLAELLRAQGDLDAARPMCERALAIREAILGPDHPATALSLGNLAFLHQAQGEYEAARPLLQRALAIREAALGLEHPDTASDLCNLTLLLADLGEISPAWELAGRAGLRRRDRIRHELASLSEGERYPYLAGLFWQLETRLSLAPLLERPDPRREAYELVLDWKGQLARLLVASRGRLLAEMSPEQREKLNELRSCQTRLSKLTFRTDIRDRHMHGERMRALREERNRLELELQRSMEAGGEAEWTTFDELRGAVPAGAAFLDFFVHHVYQPARHADERLLEKGSWSQARLSVWITRPELEEPVHLDLGLAATVETSVTVESAVKTFLEDLVALRGVSVKEDRSKEGSARVRALLWDAIAPYLEDVHTVFVSPDRFLGTLPLEVLELEDGSFLVERHAFVYVTDAVSLVHMAAEPENDFRSLLCIGGVDFRQRAEWIDPMERELTVRALPPDSALRGSFTDGWQPLPATANEAQVVCDLHDGAFGNEGRRMVLQGAEPTEERLKHELFAYSVLHLATHGFFQPAGTLSMWEIARSERGSRKPLLSDEAQHVFGKHPGLLSGLVCAGANRPVPGEHDDGYLTAEEVGWLDLGGVELVVLSACETGLGLPRSGEGLIGLRRAFHTAGAKTVISSLWSVPDESTVDLMRDFYQNLWLRGMGRLEALRAAQLAMLARNRAEHGRALPSTWGAFVLSGEWR